MAEETNSTEQTPAPIDASQQAAPAAAEGAAPEPQPSSRTFWFGSIASSASVCWLTRRCSHRQIFPKIQPNAPQRGVFGIT